MTGTIKQSPDQCGIDVLRLVTTGCASDSRQPIHGIEPRQQGRIDREAFFRGFPGNGDGAGGADGQAVLAADAVALGLGAQLGNTVIALDEHP